MAIRDSALIWVFRRPLKRPGRLIALFTASIAAAALGGASLTSAYPALVILFDPDWSARLHDVASKAWPPLRPLAEELIGFAGFAAGQSPIVALAWVLATLLCTLLLAAGAQLAMDWIAAPLVHSAAREIAIEAHSALLKGAAADVPPGELLTHFTTDLDAIRLALQKVFSKVVHEPFKLSFLLVLLVAIDAKLALLIGLLFPVAGGFVLVLSRRLRDTARRTLAQTGSLVGVIEEGLRGRRVVRAFGLEERERRRFLEVQEQLTGNLVRLDRHEALSSPLLELLVGMAAAACILLGAQRVLARDLSPEALLTFFLVMASLLDPMRKLADTQVRTQRGAAAAARLRALIASTPAQPPVHGSRPFAGLRDELALSDVSVRGSAGGAPILDAIGLKARSGEVLLVAGRSGAGKSTLLDVIAGLRRYDSGAVRLDGARLEELAPADFRGRVGLVTQETFLFRGSIAENVTLGEPARRVSLEQALALAAVEPLVASLPQGAQTPVESRAFSAGERQRLSIARALYRDPSILLLDEATSALDRPVEAAILRRLLDARAGRLTILVTHRLAPEIAVDQVVVLEQGRLVASGRPQEVLARSPLYRELVYGTAEGSEGSSEVSS